MKIAVIESLVSSQVLGEVVWGYPRDENFCPEPEMYSLHESSFLFGFFYPSYVLISQRLFYTQGLLLCMANAHCSFSLFFFGQWALSNAERKIYNWPEDT